MKKIKKYKTGRAQPAWKCCRMIRISPPNKVGQIEDVFNTTTDEMESWMCIKVNKNLMDNILQRIYYEKID